MSIFRSIALACPQCSSVSAHDAVYSINADRRPDLRVAIVDASFQRAECPACSTAFRLDPEFAFVDAGARQWIAAYPLSKLPHWKELEAQSQRLFDRVYGEEASDFLQEQGKTFQRRVTFGWAGLREKIVIADLALDDASVELCKAAILRSATQLVVDGGVDLRLLAADAEELTFAWLLARNEEEIRTVTIARAMYEEIASDVGDDWEELRSDVTAGMFADLNRLMLA